MSGHVGSAARTVESAMRVRRRLLAGLEGKLDAIEELAELIDASEGSLIFTETKEMAEEAAARLREWDVPAAALHSSMDERERRQNLDSFGAGTLRALSAPKMLDEGIDVPHADLGIVMTASRSRRQMIQRLGRVIRRKAAGVTVNFVVMYGADTVEDPEDGAHEGFFDLLLDVSDEPLALEPGWSASEIR
ncbi:MAG: hypothetical protein CMJ44_08735 [Pimelobacter sp.]|nr:hypothetical protein [Pimelobacter sp.]